jgi:hypothetical protein
MADPVEVAIPAALLAHLKAFADGNSIEVAYPNVDFPGKNPDGSEKQKPDQYLRATFLPVEPITRISGPTTHTGMLQVDVFNKVGAGEAISARVASALVAHFKDQSLGRDGFVVSTKRRLPYRTPMNTDAPWTFIPVRIPYDCHAK